MAYTIRTTTMQAHITKPHDMFNQSGLTLKKAQELFREACNCYDLDNANDEMTEAGGTGYDYSVEIIQESN